MGAATDPPDDRTDEALAYVCQRLAYLRDLLIRAQGTDVEPPELRALTGAITAAQRPGQRDLQDLLHTLNQAIQGAGDSRGVWQEPARRGLPGVIGCAPFEPLYVCPIGRCAGRHPDQSTVFPMTCTITGRELERKVL